MILLAGCSENSAPAMTHGSASAPNPSVGEPAVANTEPNEAAPDSGASDLPHTTASPEAQAATDEAPPSEERIRDISFDDLKFDINKGDPFKRSLLNEKIEALDGKRVRIRGYILPSFQQTGLTQFVLVRDNLSCCFGPGAAIYDCVIVEMKPGASTDYSLYPVAVEGKFTVSELLDPDGKTVAIYHLDGEQVR
ncbi:MAG TPA: DUF3299 domain-containing protein [Pirellulales bacterium]|nr:DUF3299 domain-containing protein [Pirellulales bacterium]